MPQYYDKVFDGDQVQIAKLSKELLYIDYYFKNIYQKKFDRDNATVPEANNRISFAHNARTICIAFVALASRYYYGNITDADLDAVFRAAREDVSMDGRTYNIFSNIDNVKYFIPPNIFAQKDCYDSVLDQLFSAIIDAGITSFSMATRYDTTLNATNYLKKDKNYYAILTDHWRTLSLEIKRIFSELE